MIDRVLLTAGDDEDDLSDVWLLGARERLAREFPGAWFVGAREAGPIGASVMVSSWREKGADLFAFDEKIGAAARLGPFTLHIDAPSPEGFENDGGSARTSRATPPYPLEAAFEILTRYQRFLPRTNAASCSPRFLRTLEKHKALHDLRKPLVAADYAHALDTWQWVLRLDPAASAAVQLAALFHDIERLLTESDERIEHKAPDYQAYKDAHAEKGAELTRMALFSLAWDKKTIDKAAALVGKHERPQGDPELCLLNDADALSFFSLNSWGFLAYYGAPHTARKVAYTLRRMRPRARRLLWPVRYHPDVERMLNEALAEVSAA